MRRQLCPLVITSVVVALLLPSKAAAGTYEVLACFADGVNHSWATARSNAFADAFNQCPGWDPAGGGMIARNTGGPGLAPGFSNAQLWFGAPPGTRVVNVRGEILLHSTGGWNAGIHDDTANQWVLCGTGCVKADTRWASFGVGALMTERVSAPVLCTLAKGCRRDAIHGYVGLRNVVVTVYDPVQPTVSITGGSLVAGGWRRGNQVVAFNANDATGISRTNVLVDGNIVREQARTCNYTFPLPCPSGVETAPIETVPLHDGGHEVRIEVRDASGNRRADQRSVWIDNTAPTPPTSLAVSGGQGWKSRNEFKLSWTNPPQKYAPLTRARIAICPAAQRGIIGCPITSIDARKGGAQGLRVPRAGEWRARLWLEDAAGNGTSASGADASLRFDDQPPSLSLARPSTDQPAQIRVVATDTGSGLGTREILLRRKGSPNWISLPVVPRANGFAGAINDENLPRGVYKLRARAADRAGNERSTERWADGKTAEIVLPLRVVTRLAVGKPKRVRARGAGGKVRYRIKLVRSPRANFGRTIPIRGRLTSPGGNPLAARDVQVLEQTNLASATWRLIATLKTGRNGRFKFKALRGPSRTLRFRFPGSATVQGRTADVRLGVRASTTIHASRGSVVNGEDVTFNGRLRGRMPSAGKLIELQARARGNWLTFRTVRANVRTGRWHYTYRFSGTRGSVRYQFRAKVPREAGFPYETGVSRRVRVTVRGL